MDYKRIRSIELQDTCTGISLFQWNKYMEGAKRADKRQIDALVKQHLPELYEDLALNFPNPYNYFRTDKHLILVHSFIEYFISYSY